MDESLELLAQYQWIYNFKLTHFFVDRVWENIPAQWTESLPGLSVDELNCLPFGKMKDEWPDTFKLFISKCLENSLPRELTLNYLGGERVIPISPSDIGAEIQKGMSEKKLHEVCHMTALVDRVTRCAGTRAVVDVGSGLGYLGQVLHGCYGHQVLGLEGKQCHTSGAEKRSVQAVKCPGLQNVTCELQQNAASMQEFLSLVQDWFHNLPADGSHCSQQTGSNSSASFSHNSSNICESQPEGKEHLHLTNSSEKTENPSTRCKGKTCHQQSLCDSTLTFDIRLSKHNPRTNAEVGSADENGCKAHSVFEHSDKMKEFTLSEYQEDESDVNTTLQKIAAGEHLGNTSDRGVYRNVCDYTVKKGDGQCEGINVPVSETNSTSKPYQETGEPDIHGSVPVSYENRLDGKYDSPKMLVPGLDSIQMLDTGPDSTQMLDPGLVSIQMLDPGRVSIQMLDPGPDNTKVPGPGPNSNRLLSSGPDSPKVVSKGCKTLNTLDPVYYTKQMLGKGSEKADLEEIQDLCVEEDGKNLQDGGVCMVGLHCCGDLTPTMLRYFVELEYIRGLCCVSCCYHRMNCNEATNQFENFPMSRCVQEAMCRMSDWFPEWTLNTYAMRLAAQETRSRWLCQTAEDHEFHTQNVAYRGLLELCLQEGHYVLKKTARKLAHRKDHSTFQAYIDKVSEHIVLPDTDLEGETHFKRHMMAMYDRYQQYFQYIEPFTALQFLIQPVLETLIHKDRQLWLKENGYHSNIIPVFNEVLSPRNLALVAIKS